MPRTRACRSFVDQYQTNLRATCSGLWNAAASTCRVLLGSLHEEGVPAELAYLPIIESGFSMHAVSHAGAVGPWQFVRGTGERYGLRIDGYVDERRDPEKATRAAARYLRDLYERFGDWHLALAGYNSGEGNIERIQNWKGCEDYWEMSDRGYLPNETSEFVPRFLAAVEVATLTRGIRIRGAERDAAALRDRRGDPADLAQGGRAAVRQRRGAPSASSIRRSTAASYRRRATRCACRRAPASSSRSRSPRIASRSVVRRRAAARASRAPGRDAADGSQRYGVCASDLMQANGMRAGRA